MSKARPGTPLHPDEPLAALLGDAVATLEALQVTTPHRQVEDVIPTLRFVRSTLAKRFPGAGQ